MKTSVQDVAEFAKAQLGRSDFLQNQLQQILLRGAASLPHRFITGIGEAVAVLELLLHEQFAFDELPKRSLVL